MKSRIDRIRNDIATSATFRLYILALLVGIVVLGVMLASMSSFQRLAAAMMLVRLAGLYLPAVALGAVIGWLSYSSKVWRWATLTLVFLTFLLQVWFWRVTGEVVPLLHLNDHQSKFQNWGQTSP